MGGTLFMVRHGQAENNVRRVLAGRSPGVPLTDEGRAQAEGAAGILAAAGVSRIYTSPLERAADTAEILASATGADVEADDRLAELDMGGFTGSGYDEVYGRHGDVFRRFYSEDPEIAAHGVETFSSVRERVGSMVRHVRAAHPGGGVALVTHMDPIKAAVGSAMGLGPETLHRLVIANASVNAFGYDGEAVWVRALNVVGGRRLGAEW